MLNKYEESISWLFEQFPSYQFKGASAYKPGLENTLFLVEKFGNPHKKLNFIHVAGTNGKGSTCSYLSSLLIEKKERVGLFTSPHIYDFRERIRVNGKEIDQEFVIDFCEKVKLIKLEFSPSFFELTLVMALCYFEQEKCSIVVLETGLGGRLDATNIVLPKLSIITNIGIDHTQFLGNTVEAIASEKAGIIKNNRPILIGEKQNETSRVFQEKALNESAKLYFAQDFQLKLFLKIEGYQRKNLQTALVALSLLSYSIRQNELDLAIAKLKTNSGLFGRMQQISESPKIILDVSHNKEGIEATLNSLKLSTYVNVHIVFGTSQDKNIHAILKLFPEYVKIHLCTFKNERSQTIETLQEVKNHNNSIISIQQDVNEAITKIKKELKADDLLLVIGSFFLISDVKR